MEDNTEYINTLRTIRNEIFRELKRKLSPKDVGNISFALLEMFIGAVDHTPDEIQIIFTAFLNKIEFSEGLLAKFTITYEIQNEN